MWIKLLPALTSPSVFPRRERGVLHMKRRKYNAARVQEREIVATQKMVYGPLLKWEKWGHKPPERGLESK